MSDTHQPSTTEAVNDEVDGLIRDVSASLSINTPDVRQGFGPRRAKVKNKELRRIGRPRSYLHLQETH